MGERNNTAVLIPAYNPSETMPELVKELTRQGFPVVVVDDGSDDKHKAVFDEIKDIADVIVHETNMGKGIALKTGIEYIDDKAMELHLDGFITADADGQHSIKDILRVADAMDETDGIVLGIRNLGKDIPIKSKIGNDLSRWVFAIVTGTYLEDNQAGLRGFSVDLCEWLLTVPGTHYEYEMNMLSGAVKKGIEIVKLPIETIYLDNNAETHFKPVLDTVRIQKSLIKKGLMSLILYAVSMILLVLGNLYMIGDAHGSFGRVILICAIIALIYVVHLFSIGKTINANKIILILFKYILMTTLLILSAGSVLFTTLSIIAVIILLPVITYVVAYLIRDRIDNAEKDRYSL